MTFEDLLESGIDGHFSLWQDCQDLLLHLYVHTATMLCLTNFKASSAESGIQVQALAAYGLAVPFFFSFLTYPGEETCRCFIDR